MVIEQAREVTAWARLLGRFALEKGVASAMRPAGIGEIARVLLKRQTGMSAIFRVQAANAPERAAFVFGDRVTSFGEANSRIERLATGLRRRGIRAGDAVAVMLHNRPEFFEIQGAMARLGGAAVSVSWRSTSAELEYLLKHSNAKAIFFEHELVETVDRARVGSNVVDATRFPVGGSAPGCPMYDDLLATVADADLDGNEGAVVIYTSGTTGRPKGAVRRVSPLQLLGFLAFLDRVPVTSSDRHLCVCPLYHSTGLGFASMALMLGGTVVIERDFEPARFLATLERERITTTAIVPTMLHRLMAADPALLKRHRADHLKAMFCGGAQLPGPLAERALHHFGDVLFNFYGATETGLVTLAGPSDLRALPGTIGTPLQGVEIRLQGEDGREVAVGEVGELYARSKMLVDGYHRDHKATDDSMREGFFSVGDLATVDANGRYMIVGRKRDMVISGGVNIYPAEVEAVLDDHPEVSQSAVLGVSDDEWGERLRAFVVLRPGATADAATLKSHCRARMSGPKVPREWVFLDALPSNPTGKILKRELRLYDGPVTAA